MSVLSALSERIDARRKQQDEQRELPDTLVLCDLNFEPISEVFGWEEYDCAKEVNDTEEGSWTIPGDHPLAELIIDSGVDAGLHFYLETAAAPEKRIGYRVDDIDVEFDAEGGYERVTVHGLEDFEHTKHILGFANTRLTPELQAPKSDLQWGRSKEVVRSYFHRNLTRLYQPGWFYAFDIWSPAVWANMNPDQWQVIMAPQIGPDTSEFTVLSSKFDTLWDFVKYTLDDAGLQITTQRWMTGDPQPFPDHFTLTKSTLILDVVERSFLSGATGTSLDPILDLVRIIDPDGASETVTIMDPNEGPQPPAGVNAPVAIWRASQHQGLENSRMTIHKASRHTVIIGGKSPQWVNASIKLLINSALGWIGTLIGLPGLGLGLFDKAVEDVILAWQRFTNWKRKTRMGPHAYNEDFVPGDAWTISGLQAGRVGLHDGRGWISFSASVVDNMPYRILQDVDLGERCGFEIANRIWLSHIVKLRRRADRRTPADWVVTVGDSREDELPGTTALRHVETIRQEVNRYATLI